jgi:hypothetical protein
MKIKQKEEVMLKKENIENDVRREDILSQKDRHLSSIEVRKAEIDIQEKEQALLERKNREAERSLAVSNREFAAHLANLKAVDHHGKQFEELQEKDAEEAKAVSEILSGVQLEQIKSVMVDAVAEVMNKK